MRSGISRGASEWSGDKVSYKESHFRVFGKSSVFSVLYRSSVEGFRGSHSGAHLPRKANMD